MGYKTDVFDKSPKSMCRCGHAGDGTHSDHHDTIATGHGPCSICGPEKCPQFSWARWLTKQERIDWITESMRRKG